MCCRNVHAGDKRPTARLPCQLFPVACPYPGALAHVVCLRLHACCVPCWRACVRGCLLARALDADLMRIYLAQCDAHATEPGDEGMAATHGTTACGHLASPLASGWRHSAAGFARMEASRFPFPLGTPPGGLLSLSGVPCPAFLALLLLLALPLSSLHFLVRSPAFSLVLLPVLCASAACALLSFFCSLGHSRWKHGQECVQKVLITWRIDAAPSGPLAPLSSAVGGAICALVQGGRGRRGKELWLEWRVRMERVWLRRVRRGEGVVFERGVARAAAVGLLVLRSWRWQFLMRQMLEQVLPPAMPPQGC